MSFRDIDEIIKARKDNLLLPMLEAIQARFGYISEANAHYLSRKTGIPFSRIYGVITSLNLIKFLASLLKIKSGETTKDRKFSLEITSCIGCCDKAPAMMINDKVYGNLDEKKIRKIILGLK